ncbi:hypothetical protein JL108_14360 [Aeromicrobium sp. YIM 150415]|uniref:hypothetical protein n=1 Tax=Aeromicrobium sp. YIM 150415 TaxID=2803912 RepID=UPI0019624A3C|nr:hypothetical protein [Aeromicrobium sp. YIM 150415]MBM9464636.1 hypothetical protein [Aeromicrobium sp. YIM 150415]
MTTEAITSGSLERIEHLDWEPICEHEAEDGNRCEVPATHRVVAHHVCCGFRYDLLTCQEHLELSLASLSHLAAMITCVECGHVFRMVLLKDVTHIDSVTPLRGGE